MNTVKKLAIALLAFSAATSSSISYSYSADIKILSAMGMKTILTAIIDDFQKETDHKIDIEYGTAGLIKQRVSNGEHADVVFVQRYLIDQLSDEGKLVDGSATDLARSPVGLAGRAGARKGDISTVEGLKTLLLEADSISYTDPAAGGLSGSHFARVLDQLGIAEQMKDKTSLGKPMAKVSNGEVEYSVIQVSEIRSLKGVEFIGPFPEELQENTPVSVAVIDDSEEKSASEQLIRFMSSARVGEVFREKGMVPLTQ